MAQKSLHPCGWVGCSALVRGRYCDAHQAAVARRAVRHTNNWGDWYRLPIWRKLRAQALLRDPWCVDCAKTGLRVRATQVDHVVPHRGDWARFVDAGNLQGLCHRCHSRKTMAEINAMMRGGSS